MSSIRKIRSNKSTDRKSNILSNVKDKEELPYEIMYPSYENVYYIRSSDTIPFRVTLQDNSAYVEKNNFTEDPIPTWKKLRKFKYKRIFIGNDNETHKGDAKYFGNTILLQLSSKRYIFIGSEIFEFKTQEPILVFESPLNYPYAYTKHNTYLIWDKSYFPTLPGKDPSEAEFVHEKENKSLIEKIDLKMIYERDY